LANLGCGQISQAAAQLVADVTTDNINRHSHKGGNPLTTDNISFHFHKGGNPLTTDNISFHSREGGNPSAANQPSAANPDAEKWFKDGVQKFFQGDFLGAIASFDQALKYKPDKHEAWNNRGLALYNLGEYQQAIASYDQAPKYKPDYHEAWNNRGLALYNLGEYQQAIASYDQALKYKPDKHEAWYGRGNALDNLGEYQQAIASYDQALKYKPDYHEAWSNRGVALGNLGEYQQAIASFDQALKYKPDDHEAWSNRGVALGNLGEYQQAIASFDQALKYKPDDHEAWYGRGNALYYLGEYQQAIASFDQALKYKPDKHEAWYGRGNALYYLGEYQQAIASFDQALKYKPDFHEAWNNRGLALYNLGEYQQAIASFDQALKYKPDFHEAWYGRGLAAGKLISAAPFIVPGTDAVRLSQLLQNPALDLRGYPGKIASYQEGLNQCPKETHPQGWGLLQHQMGRSRYFRGQLATGSNGTTTDEWGQRHNARYFYGQAVNSYQEALTVITAESSDLSFPLRQKSTENIELHLEIVADLINVLLELGRNQEAREYHQQGFNILRGLINQVWAQQKYHETALPQPLLEEGGLRVKRLQLKHILYYRFAFDFAAQAAAQAATENQDWSNALVAAELDKNIPLTWLLSHLPDLEEISPSFAEIQTLVDRSTALVYWYYSSHSFVIFILTENKLTALPLPASSLKQLEQLISSWQRYYQNNSNDPPKTSETPENNNNKNNNNSWQKLPDYVQGIANVLQIPQITQTLGQISQISQLILIPHRELHRLPLEAAFLAYWQELELESKLESRLKNIAITRLPSAAFGLRNRQQNSLIRPNISANISANFSANFSANLLMVAYPENQELKRLPYSETEAAAIKVIWEKSGKKVQNLVYKAATNCNLTSAFSQGVEQQNPQVFHFSGHAEYNQKKPNLSRLFLAGEDELTAAEIANLPLSSYSLAYINACETGVTKLATIETEYVGLVSAFLRAGVGQVISNLWPVNDEAAGLLAIKFYQAYLTGEPAETALEKAKVWLRSATWADIIQVYQDCLANASESEASILNKAKSRSEKNHPQDIPFESTYFWAGTVISGL
jgi:tetratricopeptide (TPR) repeat protein